VTSVFTPELIGVMVASYVIYRVAVWIFYRPKKVTTYGSDAPREAPLPVERPPSWALRFAPIFLIVAGVSAHQIWKLDKAGQGDLDLPGFTTRSEESAPEETVDPFAVAGSRHYTTELVARREGPGERFEIVDFIAGDTPVEVLGKNGAWYITKVNGQRGYVPMESVALR